MPRNKSPDGGYKLPAVTDPPRVCIRLMVPNDYDHLKAFWGALNELAWWNNWERDPEKRAVDVSRVWKDVLFQAEALNATLEACGEFMDVRQNPTDPCILEKTVDGLIWTPFADLSLCMPAITVDPVSGVIYFTPPGEDPIPFPPSDEIPFDPVQSHGSFGRPREEEDEDDRVCAAAANLAHTLRKLYEDLSTGLLDELVDQYDLGEITGQLIMDKLPAWIGASIGLAVYGAILAVAAEIFAHPFTDEAEEELKCIAREHINATQPRVTVDYNGLFVALEPYGFALFPELDLLRLILPTIGGDGLNIAAGMDVVEGDCSLCDEEPCSYTDMMFAALRSGTHISGTFAGVLTASGAYQATGGYEGGGCIADVPGHHSGNDGMRVIVDLGEECVITNMRWRSRVDVNTGAFNHVEVYFYAEDGGLTDHGSLYDLTVTGVWHALTSVGTTNPTRYVLIDSFDASGSVFFIDNIEINHA